MQELESINMLRAEPGTGVSVLDPEGTIHYVNDETLRIFLDGKFTREEIIGKTLHEVGFPDAWIQERQEIMRQVAETGNEYLLRTIWNGRQQFSWLRLLDSDDGETRILVITRRVSAGSEAEYLRQSGVSLVDSKVTQLGKLDVLSRRELEILALIGQGMSIKEIAELIHRSTKTVENHRISLGQKLKMSNRVQLATIAHEAGLKIDDSSLTRVELKKMDSYKKN
jgi:DNA-binding CsgD family transcriptional regulator